MILSLEQLTKRERSNSLKADLKKFLVDEVHITEDSKRIWFKGSRYR